MLFKEIAMILKINAINAMTKLIDVKITIMISKIVIPIPPFLERLA